MGYKALITIDLPKATDDQRNAFYEVLQEKKWIKLVTLTTTWKASFQDGARREHAIIVLIDDLKTAKQISRVSKVEFALQLDTEEVLVQTLN